MGRESFLAVGLASLALGGINHIAKTNIIPAKAIYFGLTMLILGSYLTFAPPKE